MAELTVGSEVTDGLDKVMQSLTDFVDLDADATWQLKQLKEELGMLKAFLEEARNRLEDPKQEVKDQVKRIADKITDITSWRQTQDKKRNRIIIKHFWGRKRVTGLATEVEEVRVKMVQPLINSVSQIYLAAERAASNKAQLIREDHVVGFEDEKEIIINYLMEEIEVLNIISIVGMPGLGKTTLAWKIFHSETIKSEFLTRIWVYIPQEFEMREMLLQIMRAFINDDLSHCTNQDLIQKVQNNLTNGKFLLVMDDVRNEEIWDDIKRVLPMSNPTAKVVKTSRENRAHVRVNHALRFLTPEESWKLLQYEVFNGLNERASKKLQGIGKEIAEQCDGLPLAIVVIGGVLCDHYDPSHLATTAKKWEAISQNVSSYIGSNDKSQRVHKIVELSYEKLPNKQRDCFLYLGVFPKGYEIRTRTLIHLWIAEGFIQQQEGQSLEQTAEDVLMDFICRNLLIVGKTNGIGQVKTCRVHDAIREFCKSEAANQEQSLFQEIKLSEDGGFDPPVSRIEEHCRLCIHSELPRFLSELFNKAPKVHSFLCFNDEGINLPTKYISTIPNNLDSLRVMDSKSVKFHIFPMKITLLTQLKYIALSCHELTFLPKEMSNLGHLQTLIVITDSPTLEMEANIWKLSKLRHIGTNVAILLLDVKLEGDDNPGKELQTLSWLSPKNCTEDMFRKASNLKRLGIRGDMSLLFHDNRSLENLIHLENLKLESDQYLDKAPKIGAGFPKFGFFPPNIKKLTLSRTYVDWNYMSTLSKISTLESLKLKDNAFVGNSWIAGGEGFRNLQFLLIAGTNLDTWNVSKPHFPVLYCLVLRKCEMLVEVPFVLSESLKKLDIDYVPKSAVRKFAEMIGKQGSRGKGELKLHVGPNCSLAPLDPLASAPKPTAAMDDFLISKAVADSMIKKPARLKSDLI